MRPRAYELGGEAGLNYKKGYKFNLNKRHYLHCYHYASKHHEAANAAARRLRVAKPLRPYRLRLIEVLTSNI